MLEIARSVGCLLLSLAALFILAAGCAGETNVASEPGIVAKGSLPFELKVYNSQQFDSEAAIAAYVERRRAALQHLASQDPDRIVEVAISPRDYLPLADLWRIRGAHSLDLDSLTLDYWVGESQGTMHVSKSTANMQGSVDEFLAGLARVAPAPPPGVGAQQSKEPRVLSLRGRLPAREAPLVDEQPTILLVDPITDLLEPYRGRALRVEMVQMPQLLAERLRIEGAR